jgi:hypothetical protein
MTDPAYSPTTVVPLTGLALAQEEQLRADLELKEAREREAAALTERMEYERGHGVALSPTSLDD